MNSSDPAHETIHTLKVQQQFMLHQRSLLAYVLSMVPNQQDAQDLLQDVFLIVSKKADTWADGTNFFAWACAIVRYEVLHYVRAGKKRIMPLDDDVLEMLYLYENSSSNLDTRIDRLTECLRRLSPRSRELISEALSSGSAETTTLGTSGWRDITARCHFSSEADFAVIHVAARPNLRVPMPDRLFIDHVRLIAKTQPVLPIRLANESR